MDDNTCKMMPEGANSKTSKDYSSIISGIKTFVILFCIIIVTFTGLGFLGLFAWREIKNTNPLFGVKRVIETYGHLEGAQCIISVYRTDTIVKESGVEKVLYKGRAIFQNTKKNYEMELKKMLLNFEVDGISLLDEYCFGIIWILPPERRTKQSMQLWSSDEIYLHSKPIAYTKCFTNEFSFMMPVTFCRQVDKINSSVWYLHNAKIPDGATAIGSKAFLECSELTSIKIPDSVTSIGASVFEGCSGLTSITILGSVTNIGNSAFARCTGLKSVDIPSSVLTIGNFAFFGCTGLTSLTIPDSVTSIGKGAFVVCTGLTRVTIPNSVTNIGKSAFSGCTSIVIARSYS